MTDRLIYLPLGGAGEIGMNAYVYGYGPEGAERYVLVDLGVTFPSMDGTPGVDLIMADIAWLEARRDRLEAIVITHAHEDHVGALGHLWPRLKAPILARRFTAAIAKNKMEREGRPLDRIRVCEPWPAMTEAGPFKIGFVPISHSIPEASMIVLDTPAGRTVHSGDFKIDRMPIVGEAFDEALLRDVAGAGIHALACDSTNVFTEAPGRSESDIVPDIMALMRGASGMVVATTFASNIARLKTLAEAAKEVGRSVCMIGRAMQTMTRTAAETGVLDDFPGLVPVEQATAIPKENLFVLATGSQGERRAASAQLAGDGFMGLTMAEDDLFLFSSSTIPGNEVEVARIWNDLAEKGVFVVADDRRYHVSGHANRPDLEQVHAILRPKTVIPMHGEIRHLREHALLAQSRGMASAIAPNGTLLDITGPVPRVAGHVDAGRTYLDGTVLIGALDGVVRDRMRLALRGHVVVSLVIEDGQPVDGAWVETLGVPDSGQGDTMAERIEEAILADMEAAKSGVLDSDEALERLVTRAAQGVSKRLAGKKPQVTVMINRMEFE